MITSKENEQIKKIRQLSQKKYREEYNLYIVEGYKMVKEAFLYAKVCDLVYCSKLCDKNELSDILNLLNKYKNTTILEVSESVFMSISDTKTPQGFLCTVKINDKNLDKTDSFGETIFVLDNIQDPGNLGTIIRTLDAAGIKDLILSNDTVDPYNPKVIRSTMGAIFRINIVVLECPIMDMVPILKASNYSIVTTSLKAKKSCYDLDFNKKLAIVMGNEANGVKKEVINTSDEQILIPMPGKAESLNVAVATGIMAFEKVRKSIS